MKTLWKKFSLLFIGLLILLTLVGCTAQDSNDLGDTYFNNVYPGKTDTYNVGSSTYEWNNGYFKNIYLNGILLTPTGVAATWGSITGILSSQSDLNTALGGKQSLNANLTGISGVTPSTGYLHYNGVSWDISAGGSGITSVDTGTPSNISGILTGNGSVLGSITDNHSNWDAGYTYRLTSASGSAPLTLTLSSNGLTGSVDLSSKQNLSTNLTSLAGLTYASASFVKMTSANTFTLDTATYLTANQSITLGGVLSGSGTTSITASYASAPSIKTGVTTRDISTASGTQTIAHGLGRTPTHVTIYGQMVFSASVSMECKGIYDGTNHSGMCIVWTEGTTTATTDNIYTSTAAELGFDNVGTVNPFSGATKASGVITVDATNITITWTKSGSPTGTVNLMWEVQ